MKTRYDAGMTEEKIQPENALPVALILAGGLSRRMGGAPKALAPIGGATLIDLVVAKAQKQFDCVAINYDRADPQAEAAFARFGLPLVADALSGHAGPLAGVLAGLDYAAGLGRSHLVTLPCDSPFLPDDLAARFAAAAREKPDGLACAASGGQWHPVAALWPVALSEDLRRALVEQGMRKVRVFQKIHGCAILEWPDAPRDPFFNINTPDDLLLARKMIGRGEKA
jgi:molybdopterin-guanine dinucleotide biosynthesis protein A